MAVQASNVWDNKEKDLKLKIKSLKNDLLESEMKISKIKNEKKKLFVLNKELSSKKPS